MEEKYKDVKVEERKCLFCGKDISDRSKRTKYCSKYCGRNVKEDKIKLHCDHIIPKSKGGKTTSSNLTTACEECNLGKADVLLSEHSISLIQSHRATKKN